MYCLLYSTEGRSFNLPETGNVTSNTAKGDSSSGTSVTLHHRDLWMKFHDETTEMILTKAGRYACMYSSVVFQWIMFYVSGEHLVSLGCKLIL